MDLKLIGRLVRMMEKSDVSELEIEDFKEGLRVHLRRGAEAQGAGSQIVHLAQAAGPASPVAAASAPAGSLAPEPANESLPAFESPMVGTFFRSPSPDAEPFVEVGARVGPDSVLCIIEAMKVMNEIKAETAGTVVEVLVENGEPVEFGQPLFLIKSD
jgi:acetyl-CoA carboxylase biotin carboxyl carrier protein